MKKLISQRPLVSFFVMAFLFSWIAITPLLLNKSLPVEPFQILGAFAGPTLSAVIVIGIQGGREGLKEFFKRYTLWKAGLIWWSIVLFGVLAALNLVAAILVGPSILTEFFRNIGLILPTFLITLVAGVILGPLWEEPGWRGYALPRLQERYGPLWGSIILGALWALWHLPGYAGGWMEASLFALLLSSIGFSIFMTWIYNKTNGSILLMILLHSSSNAAISIGGMVLPANMSSATHAFVFSGWIPAIMSLTLAVLALLFTKGTLSLDSEPVGLQSRNSFSRNVQ